MNPKNQTNPSERGEILHSPAPGDKTFHQLGSVCVACGDGWVGYGCA
jgi:hypothetical protein